MKSPSHEFTVFALSTHPPVCFVWFRVSAVVTDAAVNSGVQVSLSHPDFLRFSIQKRDCLIMP